MKLTILLTKVFRYHFKKKIYHENPKAIYHLMFDCLCYLV